MPIEIRRITTGSDELMAKIRSLYEASFPPEELRPFEQIRDELVVPNGKRLARLIVALDGDEVPGISIFALFPEASLGYLWYICVDPNTRGSGVGGRLYRESLEILRRDADGLGLPFKGMIFEVERLTTEAHPVYGDPFRRIRFYQRLGARLIEGYDYHQPPIPPHGPVPLQLMFHPHGLAGAQCTSPELAGVVSDFLRLAQGVEESLEDCELRLGTLE